MADNNEGLQSWQLLTNHNHMIELQRDNDKPISQTVEVSFYGSSAFKITSPQGVSVMLDPWRNLPTGKWDWYFYDFPRTEVDIGVSTHAHFDHDALHRLDANVLLDRLIGTYEFADVRITGIADKHVVDSSSALYDFKKIIKRFSDLDIEPPHNPRSWDNCIIIIETGDMRILHWGDNRHDAPREVWEAIEAVGDIDIALLPVDESRHIMSYERTQGIIDRLRTRVVIPHHYYIWDVVQRSSTLLPVEPWVAQQAASRYLEGATVHYSKDNLPEDGPRVDYFGDHVAFDTEEWHRTKGA